MPPRKWRWVEIISPMNKGKIVQIIGPVVDVEFPGQLPAIYNALTVEYNVPGAARAKQTLEVATASRRQLGALLFAWVPPKA